MQHRWKGREGQGRYDENQSNEWWIHQRERDVINIMNIRHGYDWIGFGDGNYTNKYGDDP